MRHLLNHSPIHACVYPLINILTILVHPLNNFQFSRLLFCSLTVLNSCSAVLTDRLPFCPRSPKPGGSTLSNIDCAVQSDRRGGRHDDSGRSITVVMVSWSCLILLRLNMLILSDYRLGMESRSRSWGWSRSWHLSLRLWFRTLRCWSVILVVVRTWLRGLHNGLSSRSIAVHVNWSLNRQVWLSRWLNRWLNILRLLYWRLSLTKIAPLWQILTLAVVALQRIDTSTSVSHLGRHLAISNNLVSALRSIYLATA